MAKFIIEIKEGKTKCNNCPFAFWDCGEWACGCDHYLKDNIDCYNYDFNTMIISKVE